MIWFKMMCLSLLLGLLGTAEEVGARKMNQWMKSLDDKKPVAQLNLLGSHDAGALQGGSYGQCQDMIISDQLELGVRFLDVRCKLIDGEVKIFHGIIDQKLKFTDLVDSCQQFLKKHPSETIIVSIKHEGGKVKQGEFGKAIHAVLELHKATVYHNAEMPLLGKVRGKMVVVSRHREVKGIPWSSFSTFFTKGKRSRIITP